MGAIEQAFKKAQMRKIRVVMPENDNPRICEARTIVKQRGLADVVGLSEPSDTLVEALMSVRPVKEAVARRMIAKPIFRACAMVTAGQADVVVAGVATPTKRVIEAASIAIGFKGNMATASSFFLMALPDGREFVFADCAVNVAPDAAKLSDIARASAASAQVLLGRASVAMLSFSTLGSGVGDSVDKVKNAVEQLVSEGLPVIGPVQADAALNPAIAAKKGISADDVNTLIFPNLDAGNIAYKLLQELAGARAVGPFLQGFRAPVCDLSRGATVVDIVAATAMTCAMA